MLFKLNELMSVMKLEFHCVYLCLHQSCNEDLREVFGKALFKDFIMGREPVSIVHYTGPGTCINRKLH